MEKQIRIVFMGTPEFAVASLDVLVKNNYNIVGVITAPDKPAGRGQQIQESAVKKYAIQHNLKLLQPEKLKNQDFIDDLKKLAPDLQIVVAFRMLPEVVWSLPKMGTFNLHASLLPKYRGAAPINWAIINREKETGVTTFKLNHEIDTGNILFQEKVRIEPETTAGVLHDKLMFMGATLILKTVQTIEESFLTEKHLQFIQQEDALACHAPKIFKENCLINWNNTAEEINSLIKGLSPYPTAFTHVKNENNDLQLIKLFDCKYENCKTNLSNGSLFTDNKNFLKVACANGYIEILEIQIQGKKRILIQEFLKGFKIKKDMIFL